LSISQIPSKGEPWPVVNVNWKSHRLSFSPVIGIRTHRNDHPPGHNRFTATVLKGRSSQPLQAVTNAITFAPYKSRVVGICGTIKRGILSPAIGRYLRNCLSFTALMQFVDAKRSAVVAFYRIQCRRYFTSLASGLSYFREISLNETLTLTAYTAVTAHSVTTDRCVVGMSSLFRST